MGNPHAHPLPTPCHRGERHHLLVHAPRVLPFAEDRRGACVHPPPIARAHRGPSSSLFGLFFWSRRGAVLSSCGVSSQRRMTVFFFVILRSGATKDRSTTKCSDSLSERVGMRESSRTLGGPSHRAGGREGLRRTRGGAQEDERGSGGREGRARGGRCLLARADGLSFFRHPEERSDEGPPNGPQALALAREPRPYFFLSDGGGSRSSAR